MAHRKEWVGIARVPGNGAQVVGERVRAAAGDVCIARQVPGRIEQRVRQPAFSAAHQHEVRERCHRAGGDVGIPGLVVAGVEQAALRNEVGIAKDPRPSRETEERREAAGSTEKSKGCDAKRFAACSRP